MPTQTKARRAADAGKRYPLNMRTTKSVRDKLEASAAKNGRSLAQEVELRIEHSFLVEDFVNQLAVPSAAQMDNGLRPSSQKIADLVPIFLAPETAPKDGTLIQALIDLNGRDLVYSPAIRWDSKRKDWCFSYGKPLGDMKLFKWAPDTNPRWGRNSDE